MADEFAVMAGQIPPDAPDFPEPTRHAWITTALGRACARCGIDYEVWRADTIDCTSYLERTGRG